MVKSNKLIIRPLTPSYCSYSTQLTLRRWQGIWNRRSATPASRTLIIIVEYGAPNTNHVAALDLDCPAFFSWW